MPLLELDRLEAAYDGVTALRGVSLRVEEGTIVTLLGANGAGKTTTLRAVSSLMRKSGEVVFDGRRITRYSPERIARLGIAHVPEGRGIMGALSVRENLRLGAHLRRDGGVKADLAEIYDYFPVLERRLGAGADRPRRRAERGRRAREVVERIRPRSRPDRDGRSERRAPATRIGTQGVSGRLMQQLAQQVVSGLATGGIYASLALALVLVYRASGVINFAQGEMAMFSTYVALSFINHGLSYWQAFFAAVAVAFAGGVVLERVAIRPVENAPVLTVVIVTIGLLVVFNGLASWIWTPQVQFFPTGFSQGTVDVRGVTIGWDQIGVIGVTLGMVLALFVFFRYTRLGLTLRAAALNPEASRLLGIRVSWMLALGWGLAAVLGAVSGMLIAPIDLLSPNMMQSVLLYAFAAAVLGGIESPLGAVVGGLGLGVTLNLLGTYFDFVTPELKLPLALGILVVVLIVRPAGLLGRPVVQRV